ncbi:MAG: C10 family peptidase [Bacteroidota bacterium]
MSNSNGLEDESKVEGSVEVPSSEGYGVNEELAVFVAKDFANDHFSKRNDHIRRKGSGQKEVEHVLVKTNAVGDTVAYLINYEEKGFAVIPADQRIQPILAFSEHNKMPRSFDVAVPGGLEGWFEDVTQAIDSLRLHTTKGKDHNNKHPGWMSLTSESTKTKEPVDPPGGGCEDDIIEKGPLLQTKWGQDEGYNNKLDDYNCSDPVNGKPVTGCVATAIAQVVRYHEYPSYVDYSIMPDDGITANEQPPGTNEVATLMHDAGNHGFMDWDCNGSTAYTSDVPNAFENFFGYSSSVDVQDYDWNDVMSEIDASRPVILRGDDGGNVGHAWVADGYREVYDCSSGSGYLFFHMNWGWEGDYNGLYSFDDFTPGSDNYDQNNKQVVGIKP